MRISRLYAQDLFSYETLDLNLSGIGLCLIEGENRDMGGSNGAGKSSIFESLVWTLFGSTAKGLKGDDVIRENSQHQPITGRSFGMVECEIADKKIQVFRHRRHKEHSNKLILLIDGKDVSMGSDRETQMRVNDLLQLNLQSFTSAVLFPQGNSGFAGLTDSDQKGILDSILGTSRFDTAKEAASIKGTDLRKQAASLHANRKGVFDQIAILQALVDRTKQQAAEWESNRLRQIQLLRSQIASLPIPVQLPDSVSETVQKLEDYFAKLPNSADDCKARLHAADRALQAAIAEHSRAKESVSHAHARVPVRPDSDKPESSASELLELLQTSSQKIAIFETSLHTMEHDLEHIRKSEDQRSQTSHCDTCGQVLSEVAKDAMFGRMSDSKDGLIREIAAAQASLSGLHKRSREERQLWELAQVWERYERDVANAPNTEAAEARLQSAEESLRYCQQARDEAAAMSDSVGAAWNQLLQLRNQKLLADQQVAQERQQRAALEARIAEVESATSNPYQTQNSDNESRIRSLEQQSKVQASVAKRIDEEIAVCDFWVEGFGNKGLKSLLFDHAVPAIQQNANLYLEVLSSGTASLDIATTSTLASGETRDRLSVSATYNAGGGSYAKASGGERRRIDLALLFALGDLGSARAFAPIQLRLLDEPFDDLDQIGSEQVVHLLNTFIVPQAGTVLVMSHNDNLKSLISKRLVVVKERGVSRIEAR